MIKVHPTAIVETSTIGPETEIREFCCIQSYVSIGSACYIGPRTILESKASLADHVKIEGGVQIPEGVSIKSGVFIGSNATFVAANGNQTGGSTKTEVEMGAQIGAAAVIMPGLRIGAYSVIKPGTLVNRDVPPNAIVADNPARIVGYINAEEKLSSPDTIGIKRSVGVETCSVRGVTLHSLPEIPDLRGSLSVGEFERTIPFAVKRYFLVYDVPSLETRGEHAHHECHQFLISVRGQCNVLVDDGKNREEIMLNRPSFGLYLPPMTWGIQYKYSRDAVVLVFASHYYDNADYIRDYGDFLRLVNTK